MLRIHTRPHRTPVAALSRMARYDHTALVSKGAETASCAPGALPRSPTACAPGALISEDILYPISFDLDHLYLLIYIHYIFRSISAYIQRYIPAIPNNLDRTIYPPIPKRIQNFLGEIENFLGATNFSRR